jgi:parallel beta-helix repeat protein
MEGNDDGIIIDSIVWTTIEDNIINNSRNYGVQILGVSQTHIVNVTISHSGRSGIQVRNSILVNLTSCSSMHNNGSGIVLFNSRDILIRQCIFNDNELLGINIEDAHHCNITSNSVLRNSVGGIYISSGTDNLIVSNSIGWNNVTNGFDDGVNNTWDFNFWSDYSGFGLYPINGNASSIDNHPQFLQGEYIIDGQLLRVVVALGLLVLSIIAYTVFINRKEVDESLERNQKEGEGDRGEEGTSVSPV